MDKNRDENLNVITNDCIERNIFPLNKENNDESPSKSPVLHTRPLIQRLLGNSKDQKRAIRVIPNISIDKMEKISESACIKTEFDFDIKKEIPYENVRVKSEKDTREDETLNEYNVNNKSIEIKNEFRYPEVKIKEEVLDISFHEDQFEPEQETNYGKSKRSSPHIAGPNKKKTKMKSCISPKKSLKNVKIPPEIVVGGPDRRKTVKPILSIEIISSKRPNSKNNDGHYNKGKKVFPCKDCREVFEQYADLKKHSIVHQVETRHKCPKCSKCFTRAHDLVLHERVHSGERPFGCTHCDKRFTQKINMIRHIRIHTNERPFLCHICEEGFIDQGDLAKHLRLHTGNLPFFCLLCKERFSSQEEVRQHSSEVHLPSDGIHLCTICGANFTDRAGKRQHVLDSHQELKPFICDHCGKSFKVKVHIIKHMSVHTGLRLHQCEYCGKKFASDSGKRLHVQRHAAVKPFSCPHCRGAAFHSRSLLSRHMRSHSIMRPFPCHICSLTFKSGDSRRRHVKVVHERSLNEYKCEFNGCNETYSVKSNMHRHMRSFHYGLKPFQCELCDASFTSKSSVVSHTKTKHSKVRDATCSICSRAFVDTKTLRRHLVKRHNINIKKEKPY